MTDSISQRTLSLSKGPRRRRSSRPSSYRTSLRWRVSRTSGRSAGTADGTYRFDRTQPRAEVYSIDTPPPTVSGSAARRPRLLLHHTDLDRPLPADARQGGLLPDGLGRQRPAHRAPGAELLRRPLRPVAALRPRLHPAGEARTRSARFAIDRPNFIELCERLVQRGREGLRGAVAHARAVGRLDAHLHHDRATTPGASASGRSCATSPAARPTSPTRRRCGTSPSRPRSPRPSSRPASTPGTTTGVAFHRPDGTTVHIETTRPELIAACVALIAHPDDERYQPLFGTTVTLADLRRRDPGRSPTTLAEPDKGAGIAMCCTFGDLTDVQWWRELPAADADRDRTRRPPQPRHPGVAGRATPRRRTPSWPARRRSPRARRWSRCSASPATSRASPRRRRGWRTSTRRATSRSRSSRTRQWYIRNGGRDAHLRERDGRPRRRDRRGCRPHAAPLRQLGGRPERRLADLAAAVLRRPVPGLVPPRRRR